MKLPQTGGCQCGAVCYEITQAPIMIYTCHCTDCQRMTSSAFSNEAECSRTEPSASFEASRRRSSALLTAGG
jgi:hypothetical protein